MSLWDAVTRFLALEGFDHRELSSEFPTIDEQLASVRRDTQAVRPWRVPSIKEALGVPAIQRAATLIANTTGSLSMQGFRNGVAMDSTPVLLARPNPYCTPHEFYRDSAWNMATRGEVVWWIASRDSDQRATALVVVPLHELTVEPNDDNRLRPAYRWGKKVSTPYSPANPNGQFVHVTYLRDSGALRGVGPLQLSMAAASVSVEAQEWAANLYAYGGYPSIWIKTAGELGGGAHAFPGAEDEDPALSEAARLKAQWVSSAPNTPRVTDSGIEDIKQFDPNPNGAQMLEARDYQNGDAARMFGIPGALMEYGRPGSSLTYQNIVDVFKMFVRTCLAPNYLEPMEQAMSDLMPRSTAARFNVRGFLRADDKTRWEIYNLAVAVLGQEEAATLAREQEGLAPGDVEYAPVPFAPPAAIPSPIPVTVSRDVRCSGMRLLHGKLTSCNRLLAKGGLFIGTCPRCKKVYQAVA